MDEMGLLPIPDNGTGDRLSQSVGGAVTTYTLDLYGGLTQVLGDGASVYLYGLGRVGEEVAAGWLYHLGDALGSVRQLAAGDGEVVGDRSYRPYGEVLESGGSGASAYGFAGEWTDGTGLVFLRARYYDPQIGRFHTRDLCPRCGLSSQAVDSYSYVANNPTNFVDPTGYFRERPAVSSDVCAGWSGMPKAIWCEPAERGAVLAIEDFYRTLAVAGRMKYGWEVGADLLEHHLDGTGSPVSLESSWLLEGPQDRERRNELFQQFVDEHLKPGIGGRSQPFVETLIASRDQDARIVPETATDIGVAIGKHYMDGLFRATAGLCDNEATVMARYQVKDRHDFDPRLGLEVNQAGIGFVPHRWIIALDDAGWAAEFDIYITWSEVSSIRW